MRVAIITYGFLIIAFGVFVFSKAQFVATKLTDFYMSYPIIRFSGRKQLASRPIFVKFFGLVVILVGILILFVSFLSNGRL